MLPFFIALLAKGTSPPSLIRGVNPLGAEGLTPWSFIQGEKDPQGKQTREGREDHYSRCPQLVVVSRPEGDKTQDTAALPRLTKNLAFSP